MKAHPPGHTFLRIEIDSEALVLMFPSDELWALKKRLASWRARQSCTKSDLSCKVIRPGWTFLRAASRSVPELPSHPTQCGDAHRPVMVGTSSWTHGMGFPCCGTKGWRHRISRSSQMPKAPMGVGHMDSSLARAGVAGIRVPVAKFSYVFTFHFMSSCRIILLFFKPYMLLEGLG